MKNEKEEIEFECINCHKKLHSVIEVSNPVTEDEIFFDKDGNYSSNSGNFRERHEGTFFHYECPYCGELLASDLNDIEDYIKEHKINKK